MGNNKEFKRKIWLFFFALALIIAYKTIDSISFAFEAIGRFFSIITPFIIAAALSYMLYKPCKSVEEAYGNSKFKFLKKHRRGLSVLTVYFIVVVVLFIIINFIRPAITNSVMELASNIPGYYTSAINFLKNLPEDNIFRQINIAKIVENLEGFNIVETILEWVSLENVSEYIKGIVSAAGVVFDIFVIIVVSVYILLERSDIKSFVINLTNAIFENKTNKKLRDFYAKTNHIFYSYISSQILDGFIVGVIAAIIMNIMGITYATLLGFMIGLFNIIPYFGAIVAVIAAGVITIFTDGVSTALWMTLIIIIVQQLDANVLNPRILGNSLHVSPILVIFATTVGGAYFGVLGMFLGVPVIALIKIFVLDYIKEKNEQKHARVVEIDNE